MRLTKLEHLVGAAAKAGPRRMAVAFGHDPHTLEAVASAAARGIVRPVFFSPAGAVKAEAERLGLSAEGFETVDCATDIEAVAAAVGAVSSGRADVLMKGMVSSDKYIRGILDKTRGLIPPGGLLTHVSVFEIPGMDRLLVAGDVAVIPAPDFRQKLHILKCLVSTGRRLGAERPRVAVLAPSEQVLPAVPSSTEAAVIAKMADRGQLGDVVADGPLSVDVALYAETAAEKGVKGSAVAGRADCLLFPNLESGNIFFKCATHMAGAPVAAMLAGTTAPCVLTSRGDTPESKLYSIALACLSV